MLLVANQFIHLQVWNKLFSDHSFEYLNYMRSERDRSIIWCECLALFFMLRGDVWELVEWRNFTGCKRFWPDQLNRFRHCFFAILQKRNCDFVGPWRSTRLYFINCVYNITKWEFQIILCEGVYDIWSGKIYCIYVSFWRDVEHR